MYPFLLYYLISWGLLWVLMCLSWSICLHSSSQLEGTTTPWGMLITQQVQESWQKFSKCFRASFRTTPPYSLNQIKSHDQTLNFLQHKELLSPIIRDKEGIELGTIIHLPHLPYLCFQREGRLAHLNIRTSLSFLWDYCNTVVLLWL